MNGRFERLKAKLMELFQLDQPDLDFGIYRIMNKKRGAIERLIAEDSPKSRSQELSQGALAGIHTAKRWAKRD